MELRRDTEIGGKLRLIQPLGHGSSGQVWLAKHLHLDLEVAVKFLNTEVSLSDTAKERFVREARTLARIRSPHVVQVHDFGFLEDRAYLVMEHLVGESLDARLNKKGTLPFQQVVRICTHIAKALQKSHNAGIVHRDIKPANVFLVDYGDEEIGKVVDFGIVKTLSSGIPTNTLNTLTQTGSLLGTPYYMSPEQIQGDTGITQKSDLWALGVIAYECVTGKLPFEANNFPRLIMAVCRDPIPAPSTIKPVPPTFDAWVEKALERDPSKRFDSARELARTLCEALLFPNGTEGLSLPDQVLPADLIWSGAYPTVSGRISRWDSDPPAAPEDPTIAVGPPEGCSESIPPAPKLSIPSPSPSHVNAHDGSLDSHITSTSPAPSREFPRALRIPAIVLVACALMAFGWFASRNLHPTRAQSATSQPPMEFVSGPASAQQGKPSHLTIESTETTTAAEPTETTLAPEPTPTVSTPLPQAPNEAGLPKKPRSDSAPTASRPQPAPEMTAPDQQHDPSKKRVCPLEERL